MAMMVSLQKRLSNQSDPDRERRIEADFADLDVEIHYLPYTVHTSSTLLRQGLQDLVSGF